MKKILPIVLAFVISLLICVLFYSANKSPSDPDRVPLTYESEGDFISGSIQSKELYRVTAIPPIGFGTLNPSIAQDNISETICNPSWSTKSIRPPVSYTNDLKAIQIKEMHLLPEYVNSDGSSGTDQLISNSLKSFEEDHVIPLELGGAPRDPRNLWPEEYNLVINGEQLGARQKDQVENYLHRRVCAGLITLPDAQYKISKDWVSEYHKMKGNLGAIDTAYVDEDDN